MINQKMMMKQSLIKIKLFLILIKNKKKILPMKIKKNLITNYF